MNWFKEQIDWLKGIFSEPDGKASSKRVMGTAVVAAFLISYIRISISTMELLDIPSGWVLMIGGIIGLNILGHYVVLKNGKNGTGTN